METSAADLETLDRLSSDVVSDAQRSLHLLRDIDNTIQALCYDRTRFEGVAKFAHAVAEAFRNGRLKRDKPFDPEGKAEESLLRAQEAARRLYDRLIEKRRLAREDKRLAEDDGVVDEYTRTIAVVADLHNGLNELRWAIGEYDADMARNSGPILESAKDLEGFLKSL
jgi:hypothetical protein